jgi:imidazole glycerol-phosphate synthase subunit HisH
MSEDLIVVDYGVGNLGSVARAFERIGAPSRLSADVEAIRRSEKLVLPGVGHFGEAMSTLRARGLEQPLRDAVAAGAHLLGICVGFQMLFEKSEEAPGVSGLGLLPGEVRRFATARPVPHIGWNQLELNGTTPLLEGVTTGDYFYFLHSYYVKPGGESVVQAMTDYDQTFCSVGGNGRVAGIQFHPEKSQQLGLRVLTNFWRGSARR